MGAPIRFIDEATGATVELEGWALPEPPIRFGYKPRRVVTDYGGRNQKSVQFLGSEFPPIELEGRWRDDQIGIPGEAKRLALALDALASNAGIVRLEYGAQQRWGVLDFEYEERRDDWIEWEAKLEVLYAEPPETIPAAIARPMPNDLGTIAEISLAEFGSIIESPPPNVAARFLTMATLALLKAQNQLTNALKPLRDVEDYAELSTDIVKLTANLALTAGRSVASLVDTLHNTSGETIATVEGVGGEWVATWRDDVYLAGKRSIADLIELARALLEQIEPVNGTTHTVSAGQTIQQLARHYYGDVSLWQRIADANDLESTTLTAGQQLRIPSHGG